MHRRDLIMMLGGAAAGVAGRGTRVAGFYEAMEKAGVEFISGNGGGPGVRLVNRRRK